MRTRIRMRVRMWIGRSGGRPEGRPPRVRSLSPSVRNVPSEKWDGRSLHSIEHVNNRPTTPRACKQPSDCSSADHATRGAGEDADRPGRVGISRADHVRFLADPVENRSEKLAPR
jgi:hypothetical protein